MKPYLGMVALSIACALPAVALAPAQGEARDEEMKREAEVAAVQWMAAVDGEQYADSWAAASALVRATVTSEQWEKLLRGARATMGAAASRTLRDASIMKTLPGAPDGLYVVMTFDSVFERKSAALEIVTMVREDDGQWRAAGYNIR